MAQLAKFLGTVTKHVRTWLQLATFGARWSISTKTAWWVVQQMDQSNSGIWCATKLTLRDVDPENTVDGRNPAPVEVGSFSHYLQGFIHPRWCRICDFHQQYVWFLCMMISYTGHCKLNKATLAENSLFYCVANWPYGQGALPVVAWYEGVLKSFKFTVTSPNPQTCHNMQPTSCASKNNATHTSYIKVY